MDLLHEGREGLGPVHVLVHAREGGARDRFEADAQHGAAARGRQLEHAVVLGELRGDARLPGDPPPLEGPHDLLGPLRRAEEVGVIDRDHARAAALDLANHLVDRAVAELEPVHERLGAERAALVTAARGLHERGVHIAVSLEQVVSRSRQAFHRVEAVRLVGAAHLALLEIVEKLAQHELDLADHDRVAMRERLLRHEARMHAAHRHRHPARPEGIGDLVAAVHIAGHGGDADEVRLQVEVDGLDVLIGEHHLVAVARNPRGHGEQARQRRVQRPVEIQRARGQRIGLRIDEVNDPVAHVAAPVATS